MILLIRDPADALLAQFHLKNSKNHIGFAPIETFHTLFEGYVKIHIKDWQNGYEYYIDNYASHQIHILRFENLKSDLVAELQRLMDFLDLKFDKFLAECIVEKQKGSFKRPKSDIDYKKFYTHQLTEMIEKTKTQVYTKLSIL